MLPPVLAHASSSCTSPEGSSESTETLDCAQILSLICRNVLYCCTKITERYKLLSKKTEGDRSKSSQSLWTEASVKEEGGRIEKIHFCYATDQSFPNAEFSNCSIYYVTIYWQPAAQDSLLCDTITSQITLLAFSSWIDNMISISTGVFIFSIMNFSQSPCRRNTSVGEKQGKGNKHKNEHCGEGRRSTSALCWLWSLKVESEVKGKIGNRAHHTESTT